MAEDNKFELVVCIVNAGYSETVMNAARSAGAKGGSIVRGRGSANPEAEEFFGITITPDKEMVLILVKAAIKDAVMKAIYKKELRSYFVNPKYVKLLSKNREGLVTAELLVPGVEAIPVSKQFYKQLSELL